MEGDFSRGHRPDAKRGKRYRRVLVKQGAAILDSDLAALVDAQEQMVREAVTHTACAIGSSDLGFLVTPGRLLALFDPVDGEEPAVTAPAEAVRDFSRKYLDRLPGLRVRGSGGSVAVTLRLNLTAATPCIVWLRADAGATARLNGNNIVVPAGTDYAPFPVTLSGATLTLEPDPAQPYWIAMVETSAPSGEEAAFHWAAGEYQIGGVVSTTGGAAWPGLSDPAGQMRLDASTASPGTRMLAYVEITERHVTRVEDPGILEQALGGDHDTTTRSEVFAQLKLAPVEPGVSEEDVTAATMAPALPSGMIALGTVAGTTTADPCDLPVPGGYNGPENRLYRMAVHEVTTGPGAQTLLKWSRENGSELFPAEIVGDPVTALRVTAELRLRQGDLVELLSDATELADAADGQIGGAGFTRPQLRQGRLVRLHGGSETDAPTRTFTLREPDGSTLPSGEDSIPAGPLGTEGIKLRRWSGLISRSGTGPLTADVEDGIQATITGEFEPGDWWQYEARVLADNANGPPMLLPHGPERLFAPLSLLEQTAPGAPMLLVAWLDQRYRHLCETEADAVAYDGDRTGTEADTVQEALDELYLRVSDGCGEIAVPVGSSIQDVINAIPADGSARICLNAGTRDLASVVTIADKGDLIIGGIGPGTLLRRNQRMVLDFVRCRSVDLRDFAVDSVGGSGAILRFRDCEEITISGLSIQSTGASVHGASAIRITAPARGPARAITITGNRITVGQGDSGIVVVDPGHATIRDNVVAVQETPFDFIAALDDPLVAAAVGNILIDRVHFHGGDGGFDFIGGPVIERSAPFPWPESRSRKGIGVANGVWGRSTMSFTTSIMISASSWARLIRANPSPQSDSTSPASVERFLRGLRRRFARAMFGLPTSPPVSIPADVRPELAAIVEGLAASNKTIHGIAGIVVALNRTAMRSPGNEDTISRLFPQGPGQIVTVNGNHVSGFTQGIRCGTSSNRLNMQIAHSVDVLGNHVELRLPSQAYQRNGIFVGNALAARVVGNRVEDLGYTPINHSDVSPPPVDADGIRLYGTFGPLVEVTGNLCYGVSCGLRFSHIGRNEPLPGRADTFVRTFRDNAYVGDYDSEILST